MVKLLSDEEAKKAYNQLMEEMSADPLQDEEAITSETLKMMLKNTYDDINHIIDYYMDVPKPERNIITLWIMGTYFHEHFETYPYLFVNAMRGSGKTRLLKIIASLSKQGNLINSVTEAILFRTTGCLCLDEFEGVGKKENNSLRELLNSAYKKGTKVFRMRKKKNLEGEAQVVEEFQPYRPIVMANIWGMEEVLGDRCLSVVLERSLDLSKIKITENFDELYRRQIIEKQLLFASKCSLCSVVTKKNIKLHWNHFIKQTYTHTTSIHNNTYNYTNYTKEEIKISDTKELLEGRDVVFDPKITELFKKIDETGIDGRNLELFFPMFLLAYEIEGEETLNQTLDYAKHIVQLKKTDEITESNDVMVYNLISSTQEGRWYGIKELTSMFRLLLGDGENEWVNARWLGRAIKRLKLMKQKRRVSSGIEVILNVEKATRMKAVFMPISKEESDKK